MSGLSTTIVVHIDEPMKQQKVRHRFRGCNPTKLDFLFSFLESLISHKDGVAYSCIVFHQS